MNYENFEPGEYVRKDRVMTYLKVFDYDMPREELIERFKQMDSIKLSESDVNKVKINKLLSAEWHINMDRI